MYQQTLVEDFTAADKRKLIPTAYLNTGNIAQVSTTGITKFSRRQEIQGDGYSIRANCTPNDPMCIPNLLSGNKPQKNNLIFIQPQITWTKQTTGALTPGYYRTPNIF